MKRAAALLAVLALVATGVVLMTGRGDDGPRTGSWSPMASSPLSPRHGALAVPLDTQVLLLGGDASPLCPPGASCVDPAEPLRDGAAYDVRTRRWRRIADAPVPLGAYFSAVVVGQVVHLLQNGTRGQAGILTYDVAADRWGELADPPHAGYYGLTTVGGQLIAVAAGHEKGFAPDWLLDDGSWRELPRDPLAPSGERRVVDADGRLLLVSRDAGIVFEKTAPWLRAAVLDLESRRWTALPDTRQVVAGNYAPLVWTGTHAVLADPYPADAGGLGSPGNGKPGGGFLDLDTGRWAPLPDPPETLRGFPVHGTSPRYVGGFGLLLDTREREWVTLPERAGTASYQAAQAWVDGALVVWGGGSMQGGEPVATGAVWSWDN